MLVRPEIVEDGAVGEGIHHYHLQSLKIQSLQNISREHFIKIQMLSFKTRTQISNSQRSLLKDILHKLMTHKLAYQFLEPVDWQGLGLEDYPSIVKQPMDLSSIKQKLEGYQYSSVQDVLMDIELVWTNCISYNTPNHWLSNVADKLKKQTQKLLRNYFPGIKFKLYKEPTAKAKEKHLQAQKKRHQIISDTIKAKFSEKSDISSPSLNPSQSLKLQASQKLQTMRQTLLDLLSQESDSHVGMLFLMMHRRCPKATSHEPNGDMKVDLQLLDVETIERALLQLQRWGSQ